jgi:hypothetical protein
MANHAYVVPSKMPTFDQVDAIVCRVVAEKFPMMVVESYRDKEHSEKSLPDLKGGWFVYHPNDKDYFGLKFWFGTYLIDVVSKLPHVSLGRDSDSDGEYELAFAVEFQHGHSFEILWWMEYEIREAVGRELNAHMFDDGVGDMGKPRRRVFKNFRQYQYQLYRNCNRVAGWDDFILKGLEEGKAVVPEDVRPLYGV